MDKVAFDDACPQRGGGRAFWRGFMSCIEIIYSDRTDHAARLAEIKSRLSIGPMLLAELSPTGEPSAQQKVRVILADVRRDGDDALVRYSRQFDQFTGDASALRVSAAAIAAAASQADTAFIAALDSAIANVRRYQQAMLPPEPAAIVPAGGVSGARLAVRYQPLQRVGVYVPGGAGAYPSTVVMSVVPAQVAGVKEICICSPVRGGQVSAAVLAAASRLGIGEVYAVGGAQAIAAMAFGTQSIRPVDKIVGPGNTYVQLAKKELFGVVDIDSFAGPSEVIVLADDSASPVAVAAELLAQAEHAPGSCLLITASSALAAKVQQQMNVQLAKLPRCELTTKALAYASALVVAPSHDAALAMVNEFAPEHLQITTRDARGDAFRIVNAGAIFIGEPTPVAAGDYLAGPSHVLPTSGTARFFSGLSAESFRKRISMVEYDAGALHAAADAIVTLARGEGFEAHARSVMARRDGNF